MPESSSIMPQEVASAPGFGGVVELRPHARQDFTSSLGMVIFLASWAMMFSALFFAYGFIRAHALAWPPVGMPRLPIALPAFNTVVLLASSYTFRRGVNELRGGARKSLVTWIGATLVLGAVFLVLQVMLWQQVIAAGVTVATGGVFGSVFYALTIFHALHVAVGLVLLLWVLARALAGKYTEHNHINVRLCAMYWHFVDVVWVLMFLTLFLL